MQAISVLTEKPHQIILDIRFGIFFLIVTGYKSFIINYISYILNMDFLHFLISSSSCML